jgi:hypothetical protein
MTELTYSTMLRYYTGENGKHYTATVLKDNKILSLKKAGEKDKTVYESLIHWIATLPEGVTTADLDIKERERIPKAPSSLKKNTITLKDIAPNYDLLRFLLTYEAYSLKNSLTNKVNVEKLKTRTYVKDVDGDLHPVKYNRHIQLLYSEHHNKIGANLEEIGFPKDADIYVSVPGVYYGKRYVDLSFSKAKFPFTITDYESFYNAKFAFIVSPILQYCWAKENKDNESYHHNLICNYLKKEGYYIYTQFFRMTYNDSIFFNKMYKYFEGNITVVQPNFNHAVVYNYKPMGFVKIPFNESDEVILGELKSILE